MLLIHAFCRNLFRLLRSTDYTNWPFHCRWTTGNKCSMPELKTWFCTFLLTSRSLVTRHQIHQALVAPEGDLPTSTHPDYLGHTSTSIHHVPNTISPRPFKTECLFTGVRSQGWMKEHQMPTLNWTCGLEFAFKIWVFLFFFFFLLLQRNMKINFVHIKARCLLRRLWQLHSSKRNLHWKMIPSICLRRVTCVQQRPGVQRAPGDQMSKAKSYPVKIEVQRFQRLSVSFSQLFISRPKKRTTCQLSNQNWCFSRSIPSFLKIGQRVFLVQAKRIHYRCHAAKSTFERKLRI